MGCMASNRPIPWTTALSANLDESMCRRFHIRIFLPRFADVIPSDTIIGHEGELKTLMFIYFSRTVVFAFIYEEFKHVHSTNVSYLPLGSPDNRAGNGGHLHLNGGPKADWIWLFCVCFLRLSSCLLLWPPELRSGLFPGPAIPFPFSNFPSVTIYYYFYASSGLC